jgi:hypothetical protein
MIHSLCLAACSLCQCIIGKQSRSRIHSLPNLGSAVVAQGATYGRQDLDRQMDESGI